MKEDEGGRRAEQFHSAFTNALALAVTPQMGKWKAQRDVEMVATVQDVQDSTDPELPKRDYSAIRIDFD